MGLKIEMVSDVVCPWCWVGLKRLHAARALCPDLDIETTFRPFELDPDIPSGGTDYKAYMAEKFGSNDALKARGDTMKEALVAIGAAEGIAFNFDRIARRPNTLSAHRLIGWAQGQGLGEQAKAALFHAFFSDGLDIGNHEILVTLAAKIGLDANVVSDLLASDADIERVQQEEAHYREMGVSGVPTFIANGKYAIQGAQDANQIASFFRQVADSPENAS